MCMPPWQSWWEKLYWVVMKNRSSSHKLAPLQLELRAAMASQGCPLCRLATKAERTFIDSLNYERVLDLKTRDALKASRGLCDHHSRVWQHVQGSALGVAIVYRISILDLLRDTGPDRAQLGPVFRRRRQAEAVADRLRAEALCPACIISEDTAERFGGQLLEDIRDAEVQALLVVCGGLCLPHLRQVLTLQGAERAHKLLMRTQRQAWAQLMGELEEFIRKNDYRFSGESMTPDESTSWTRALDVLVGLRDSPDRG
jgi:hypothetical protein